MKKFYIILTIILLGTISCEEKPVQVIPVPPVPEQTGDGWQVASLEDQQIVPEKITWLSNMIGDGDYGIINSLLIVRNDYLVFEKYYHGYDREQQQNIGGITQTVTSSLVGIALDLGYITSVEDGLEAYLPEYDNVFNANTEMKRLKIVHALSMRTGVAWEEWTLAGDDPRNTYYQMKNSDDWLRFVLERPVSRPPGLQFEYAGGNAILLAGVLHNATGMHADEFALTHLFQPLQIEEYEWIKQLDGLPLAGDGLRLRPRDLAKIGNLYLNQGSWHGTQVIPEDWVNQSVMVSASINDDLKYGYSWWLRQFQNKPDSWIQTWDILHSWGYGGQHMFVIPSLQMVVIFTSRNENNYSEEPVGILYDIILDCVVDFQE